jgi:DNA polymerase III epsilon subunit-like protein
MPQATLNLRHATERIPTGPILRWDAPGPDGRPIYRSGCVPDHLATKAQLSKDGLSAAGLPVVAWLHYNPLHGICALFEKDQARPKKKLTALQLATLAAGRALRGTVVCTRCGQTRSEVGEQLCTLCLSAWRAERQAAAERRFAARMEAEAQAEQDLLEQLAADRRAAAVWARQVLADPGAVIFDSETTGLEGSYAVEVAVIRVVDRTVLLKARLNPGVPIEPGATAVHGITDADVVDCPPFASIADELWQIMSQATRVVIYNKAFDTGVLTREVARLESPSPQPEPPGPDADNSAWQRHGDQWLVWYNADRALTDSVRQRVAMLRTECAMQRYAEWYGAWHDYHGSYTWQRLGGPHGAVEDCQTVITRLQEMAASLPTDAEA